MSIATMTHKMNVCGKSENCSFSELCGCDDKIWKCEYKMNGNTTEIDFENYPRIIIIHPTPERDYYIVTSSSTDEWIHSVNIYSSIKKPSENVIIKLIRNNIKKNQNTQSSDDLERYIRKNTYNTNEFLINEFLNTQKNLEKNGNVTMELINNEIDKWKISLKNFTSNEMKNYVVEIYVDFDKSMYPNVPPAISKITPTMGRSLNRKIPKLTIISKEKWKTTTNMIHIIDKIYDIVNSYGKISNETTVDEQLNILIEKLAEILGVNTDFIDIEGIPKKQVVTQKQISGQHGIGYDDVGVTSRWLMDTYVQKIKERNTSIPFIMMDILNIVSRQNDDIYKFITETAFFKCITMILNEMTPFDVVDNDIMYCSVYNVLNSIPPKYLSEVCNIPFDGKTLFECVENNRLIVKNPEIDVRVAQKVLNFAERMEKYAEQQKQKVAIEKDDEYTKVMTPFRFGEAKIADNGYYYKANLTDTVLQKKTISRIFAEYTSLQMDLPTTRDASIFVKVDPSNISTMRALIIGPKDTPYENGCFIFDIYIPGTYPAVHPEVHFMNHNGCRMNPNLYSDGKICLSLLGTWGNQTDKSNSENWNPATSTIFQVLLSIQSQILVEEPWFNEPGRDSFRNNDVHKNIRIAYNEQIQMYTLQHAIFGMIENCDKNYSEFAEIIKNHFRLKKEDINNKYANICYTGGNGYYNSHKHVIESL